MSSPSSSPFGATSEGAGAGSGTPGSGNGPSLRPSRMVEGDGQEGTGIMGDHHAGERISKRRRGNRATQGQGQSPDPNSPQAIQARLDDLHLDTSEFYVPARDAHGHAERFQFYVLHGDMVECQAVVNSHLWPYESVSSLIRHALRRHIQWLDTIQPRPSMIGQVLILTELLRDDKYNADFVQVFDDVSQAIDRYKKMRRPEMAESLLRKVLAHVASMPDDGDQGRWKARYQQRIRDEWESEYPVAFAEPVLGTVIQLLGSGDGGVK